MKKQHEMAQRRQQQRFDVNGELFTLPSKTRYILTILSTPSAPMAPFSDENQVNLPMCVSLPGDEKPLRLSVRKIEKNRYLIESRYSSEYVQGIVRAHVRPGVEYCLVKVLDEQNCCCSQLNKK
jgi:hypothetical protein